MTEKTKISVIIPVYNAEKFLHKCIKSLLAQTFNHYEIILVDDGSNDKSFMICNQYAQIDNRIRVYHKKNNGVSISRQYGLEKATGIYFIFVDADDYVEPQYLENLYTNITEHKADIAICSYWEEYQDHRHLITIPNFQTPHELIHSFLQDKVWGVTWNKLYKTSLVKEHNIRFIPHLQMWEDLTFTIDYCLYTKKIVCVDTPLYHYVKTNTHSITSKEDIPKKIDRIKSIKHFENTMKSRGVEEIFHNSLIKVKFHICKTFLNRNFTKERINYFLTSFPEIFNDKYFIKNYPISYIMIKLRLVKYLNIECFIKYYKGILRSTIKNIFRTIL